MADQMPITFEEVIAVVQPTSRVEGGATGDIVTVHSLMRLASPVQSKVNLVLPVYAHNSVDAVLQPLQEFESRFTFNDPVPVAALPEDARQEYQVAIRRVQEALESAEQASLRFAYRTITIEPGSLELRFDQQFVVEPDAQGIFNFKLFLPLTNTPLQQGGVITAVLLFPPNAQQPGVQVSGGGTPSGPFPIMSRQAYGFEFRADPVLTATYRY